MRDRSLTTLATCQLQAPGLSHRLQPRKDFLGIRLSVHNAMRVHIDQQSLGNRIAGVTEPGPVRNVARHDDIFIH